MLKTVNVLVPKGSDVLEAAAGTGSISIAVSDKTRQITCTDVSEKMLNIARRKITKLGIKNITVEPQSICKIEKPDNSYDVVIAGQILHLIDEPEKAAMELKRIAKQMVILPMSFTKNLQGTAKLGIAVYRFFGFAPKREFTSEEYKSFLPSIGFENCDHIQIPGKIPMAVAVWRK
jgi:ubiquinone/menaquinone biosynthesis C-methylase UbiE